MIDNKLLVKIIELIIHLLLVVAVPVIYLQITTDFNEYRLPEQMPVVYVYWLLYMAIIAVIYGRRQRKKTYKSPFSRKK